MRQKTQKVSNMYRNDGDPAGRLRRCGAGHRLHSANFSPTEERILTAALGLIGRRGVRRLGMQEIAEAAGVSRGTLYRYFPSKDHVLTAAADFDERRFSVGLDEVLAAAGAPEEQIGAFMAYAFDFIRSHPCRPSSSPSPVSS